MATFIESCVETVADTARMVEKTTRHHPRAARLIKLLKDKQNILVTTHIHPDPDALASSYGMAELLKAKLKNAHVSVSVKGRIGGGYNSAFMAESQLELVPWDEDKLKEYDAIVLLDVQPGYEYCPLPEDLPLIGVVDHHRSRLRKKYCPFHDVRTDVGATSSIIFSYLMDLEVPIGSDLAAALLFAIETDLSGAAGQPDELDNIALSSLTLQADPRRLYRMRTSPLPLAIYDAYNDGLQNAMIYDNVLVSHIPQVESQETPAVLADFLMRYERLKWVLVTGVIGNHLLLSLRMRGHSMTAAEVIRHMLGRMGEGGGHRFKAGGSIRLKSEAGTAECVREVRKIRTKLLKRIVATLGLEKNVRGTRLVKTRDD